jgi:hypothetical protein
MEKPNKEKVRPVISFKIERNTLESFNLLLGEVERTRALNNIIKYLTMPANIQTARQIIQYNF